MILWFCVLTAFAAQAVARAQHSQGRLGVTCGRGSAAAREPQVLTGRFWIEFNETKEQGGQRRYFPNLV